MADSKFVNTPIDFIAHPPADNKGGPGEYNGDKTGPLGAYGRTPSPNAVPEKTRDGGLPTVQKSVTLPDEMPKHMK